jgi:hypothetical protein
LGVFLFPLARLTIIRSSAANAIPLLAARHNPSLERENERKKPKRFEPPPVREAAVYPYYTKLGHPAATARRANGRRMGREQSAQWLTVGKLYGSSFTVYRQEHEPPSVQVPHQPDEARLIGADCKQRCSRIGPYHRHLKRAPDIDLAFVHLPTKLNEIGAHIVHGLSVLASPV